MKFDEILATLGDFGPYQKRVYILCAIVILFLGPQLTSVVFTMAEMKHRCSIPFLRNDSYEVQGSEHQAKVNEFIPNATDNYGENVYSKCTLYNVTNNGDYVMDNGTIEMYKCESWVYDTSAAHSSVVSEFDLVCDATIFHSHTIMVSFVGGAAGSFVFGPLSDIIGRKKSLLACIALLTTSGLMSALSVNYDMMVASAFFVNMGASSLYDLAFVIGIEIVGPSKRTLAGIMVNMFFITGMLALNLEAYFVRDWRHLRLVNICPCIALLSYWWLLPESPRWLISKERTEEAAKVLRKVAESNHVKFDEKILANITPDDKEEKGHFWKLLLSPTMLFRIFSVSFCGFANMVSYMGLTLNVQNLSGNFYLNFFFNTLVEAIAYLLAYLSLRKFGRKTIVLSVTLLCGFACVAAIFPVLYGDSSTKWTLTLLSMIAKIGSSAGFAVSYMYTSELFPTVVRQSVFSIVSFWSSVGAMIVPYIADLAILVETSFSDALPLMVFGIIVLISVILLWPLPETKGRILPETVEDAISFSRQTTAEPNVEAQEKACDVTKKD